MGLLKWKMNNQMTRKQLTIVLRNDAVINKMEKRRISPTVADIGVRASVQQSIGGKWIIGSDSRQKRRVTLLLSIAINDIRISARQNQSID